jgi:hypothetical protein
MMGREGSDLVAGGYILTHLADRPSYTDAALIPSRLLTASDCIASMFPSFWALPGNAVKEQDRVRSAREFGLAPADLPRITEYMAGAIDKLELGWPCVWLSTRDARAAAKEFLRGDKEIVLVGLAMTRDGAEEFLAEAGIEDRSGWCGMLRTFTMPELGGRLLGWEVLGYEIGWTFHSWLCDGLEKAASDKLGIRSGANGLLARALCIITDVSDGNLPIRYS